MFALTPHSSTPSSQAAGAIRRRAAPLVHRSSLTCSCCVALCCVVLRSVALTPAADSVTHIWKVSQENLRGCEVGAAVIFTSLQSRKMSQSQPRASAVHLFHPNLHLGPSVQTRPGLHPAVQTWNASSTNLPTWQKVSHVAKLLPVSTWNSPALFLPTQNSR